MNHTLEYKSITNNFPKKNLPQVDSDEQNNLFYWQEKFKDVYNAMTEISSKRSVSTIIDKLTIFQLLMSESNYPPIEFLIDCEAFNFILIAINPNEESNLIIKYLAIIDCFIVYTGYNYNTLVDFEAKNIINQFQIVLSDKRINESGNFLHIAFLIIKILKTSCNLSKTFSMCLFESELIPKLFPSYISLYDLKNIIFTQNSEEKNQLMNFEDHDVTSRICFRQVNQSDYRMIVTSFLYIVEIISVFIKYSMYPNDEAIIFIFDNCVVPLMIQTEIRVVHNTCNILKMMWKFWPAFPNIFIQRNIFKLCWDATLNFFDSNAMDLLSQGLITDSISQQVAEIIDIHQIILMCFQILNNEEKQKSKSENVSAAIILIANYCYFLNSFPTNINFSDIYNLVVKVYENENFEAKNLASFLILIILSFQNVSELDSLFSEEFITIFFDSIISDQKDVIEKALDVFKTILEKAQKMNYNINNSNFIHFNISSFLEEVIHMENDLSADAENLFHSYFHS